MDGDVKRPQDTREFMARWNAATEEHLTHQLQGVLDALVQGGTLPSLTPPQSARLAPMLVQAFQVAATPDGGAHAAIQYLSEQAAEPGG
jgi:hypothetical protein